MFIRHLSCNAIKRLIVFISAAMLMSFAWAHDFKLGDIQILHPYARATVAQQNSGGAYLSLENRGKTDDRLIRVETGIAKSAQIHNMEMAGDVMKMREVDGIELKAGAKLVMQPGMGYHIMLVGLNRQLKAGDQFMLTLYFAKAGKIEVAVHVEANP